MCVDSSTAIAAPRAAGRPWQPGRCGRGRAGGGQRPEAQRGGGERGRAREGGRRGGGGGVPTGLASPCAACAAAA